MNKIQSVCQRFRQCINSVLYPAVLQSKDQPMSLLYADVKDENNGMIWKMTIIKYMQVFSCRFLVQPNWIPKNLFTKDLRTKDLKLALAKLYLGTMNKIDNY